MRIKPFIAVVLYIILQTANSYSKEGMWLPNLLKQLNESDLKKMGLQIPVDELFSPGGNGLNDAVVQFGGGCTGEIVSGNGLLFTNHHCGFSQIQSLSTLEHNYLENGYWASGMQNELACPGLTATFIREIKDVSSIFNSLNLESRSESDRDKIIKATSDSLEKSVGQERGLKGMVRSFFGGNEFYLFITETFSDIRFVGAPPSNVGNFGGETDNWMWPRHTGDFSVFRIYAGKDNKPAEYDKDNVPYKPKRFLTINASGIHENDFTMVYGFPGRTQEYLTSGAIDLILRQSNPNRIMLRDIRMNVWSEAMNGNDTIRLQYASKFRSLANSYKRWKGELTGLRKSNAVKMKTFAEQSFADWSKINSPDDRFLVDDINAIIDSSGPVNFANDFYTEGFQGVELIALATKGKSLNELCRSTPADPVKIKQAADKLLAELPGFYKNYRIEIDRQATALILQTCAGNLPGAFQPRFLDSFKKEPEHLLDQLFRQSIFDDQQTATAFLTGFTSEKFAALEKDPVWKAAEELQAIRTSTIEPALNGYTAKLAVLQRRYIAALRKMNPQKPYYPDANSTLRLSYGKVEGLTPKDGVNYTWQTTSEGIIEKHATGDDDYSIDPRLLKLLESKDFGRFASQGKLPVAFLASNHTTGGNSGSPVLNAKGELVGINFDRIWEGVMSDLYYNSSYSRNVSVDIRYVLFIIAKFGGSDWLLNEMRIKWQ